ncbi:phytoene/squalene synthase family protein [Domibacillus indicus]|uniref:phytoene/squalene synthase family protein n=1 Tax=Domibacillus indicus TaxID=1437523 RepID=UPI000617C9D2|nr:phytoene/squalene synthase family protein [Domibacillus indicus]
MNTIRAYQICEDIMKHHSKTFYAAFSRLPEDERRAVAAVYAFCRKADDIVDEGSTPVESLAEFKKETGQFFSGSLPNEDPLWTALRDASVRFSFSSAPFFDMLKGQQMDIDERSFQTMEDILDYSYHVAGTVGVMLLPILAPNRQEELYEGAVKLGNAMQITNILRDIGEDLEKGRLYLPRDLMNKHGLTEAVLQAGVADSSFIGVWEEMAGAANKYYEEASETLALYPSSSRFPVMAAALFYQAILEEVRTNQYDVFTRRNHVSHDKKQQILSFIS